MLLAKAHQQTDRSIPFSVISCVVGTFLVLACIVLAYIAGVMSGRASAARDNVRLGYSQSAERSTPVPTDEKLLGVLSPEELEYARALRSETSLRSKKTVVADKGALSSKKDSPDQSQLQKNVQGEGPANRQESVGVEKSSVPQDTVALFDYVFQVAAMRTEDSVDALWQRLEGRGLRTRMQREGKMYYVLVLLRGDELRATEVVQTLDSMRLGKPLMRSRKAVIQ